MSGLGDFVISILIRSREKVRSFYRSRKNKNADNRNSHIRGRSWKIVWRAEEDPSTRVTLDKTLTATQILCYLL